MDRGDVRVAREVVLKTWTMKCAKFRHPRRNGAWTTRERRREITSHRSRKGGGGGENARKRHTGRIKDAREMYRGSFRSRRRKDASSFFSVDAVRSPLEVPDPPVVRHPFPHALCRPCTYDVVTAAVARASLRVRWRKSSTTHPHVTTPRASPDEPRPIRCQGGGWMGWHVDIHANPIFHTPQERSCEWETDEPVHQRSLQAIEQQEPHQQFHPTRCDRASM